MGELPAPGRYEWLEFNAPLSDGRADAIARALAETEPTTVLDIGCGWGELLLRTLAAAPQARGWGIDTDPDAIARARANATARGLADRVRFIEDMAPTDHEPADVVICVGSDHAYGSQSDALSALHLLVAPGGQLLFGGGFWELTPTTDHAAAVGLTPDALPDLAGLVDLAVASGFRPLFVQTANRDEWERFESGYLADWERWLHRHGDRPEADEIRARADAHRSEWLRGYRHILGFAYLTLGRL
ncbi:MAG TPA: class I SAM-dependent methyltransferase [Gaiellaceae bacterium]